MTQHTPGPWWFSQVNPENHPQTKPHGNSGAPTYDIGAGDYVLANIIAIEDLNNDRSYFPGGSTKANARLIAAAPELLEALQAQTTLIESNQMLSACASSTIEAARAAIAKATNEE